jgi:hypothetical protein
MPFHLMKEADIYIQKIFSLSEYYTIADPSKRNSEGCAGIDSDHLQQLLSRSPIVIPQEDAVFWDVTPCGSCKNRPFGGK